MNNKDKVVTMSNVLQKSKDDWVVIKQIYNLADDNIDVGSRITSTTHKICNLSEIPEKFLRHGAIVEGYLTNDMFHITYVKPEYKERI